MKNYIKISKDKVLGDLWATMQKLANGEISANKGRKFAESAGKVIRNNYRIELDDNEGDQK